MTIAADKKTPGRLKIFLGAAPGVGKTYEMLTSARQRRREGIDVVVGVVETHGRAETQAMLDGLEILPRRRMEYKGRAIEEMDLDAVLARRPQLVLVDELAHTNGPESRHPKRFLDVEEILATGIDVYSTLNIQHVESLNTVIAQITRIRVRETVPDSILDRADDIEAIDLAPDDLIRRLQEGKVYLPKQAERALKNFFSPGNLTALRELTLRRTAQRVDEQLLTHMQAHAIRGPWAAGERVLVCISEDPRAAALVRFAKRIADRLHATMDRDHHRDRPQPLSSPRRSATASPRRCAWPSDSAPRPITMPSAAAAISPTTSSLTPKSQQLHPDRRRQDQALALVRDDATVPSCTTSSRAPATSRVHVIAGDELSPARRSPKRARGMRVPHPPREPVALSPYAAALAMVACALAVAKLIEPSFGLNNVDLVFLTAIVGVAVTFGLYPSLLAVIAGDARLQFLLPAAALHVHHRRSDQRRGAVLLHARRGARLEPRGADPGSKPRSRRPARGSPRRSTRFARKLGGLRLASTTCCGQPPTRWPRCCRPATSSCLLPEGRPARS